MRARGVDAWSCDILPSEDSSPHHYHADAIRIAYGQTWDCMIAHPECRFMTNSAALRLYINGRKINGPDPDRWARLGAAAAFFRALWNAPIEKIAIENPIMVGHVRRLFPIPPPSQTIQPYEFGDDASKATCLWLKGLPPLRPTTRKAGRIVEYPAGSGRMVERWSNQTDGGQNRLGPSETRSADRARTYPGIAAAITDQWTHACHPTPSP